MRGREKSIIRRFYFITTSSTNHHVQSIAIINSIGLPNQPKSSTLSSSFIPPTYLLVALEGIRDDGVIECFGRHISLGADFVIGAHVYRIRGFDVHNRESQISDATLPVSLR